MKKSVQLFVAVAIVAIGIGLMWFVKNHQSGSISTPIIPTSKPGGVPSKQSIETAVVMADGSVIARTKFSFGMASGTNSPAVVLPRNNQQ